MLFTHVLLYLRSVEVILLSHSPVASPEVSVEAELSGLGCAGAKEKPPKPLVL